MTQMISDEEIDTLAVALIKSQGPSTEAEIMRLVKWASTARTMNHLVNLILDGEVRPNTRDNADDITIGLAHD